MIAPTILVVIIYTIIDSFTDYGNIIMRMIDDYADNSNYSYSTAIALVYFLIVAALIGIVTLCMRKFTRSAEY
jgi:ABC-type sugar transport system permease subunit